MMNYFFKGLLFVLIIFLADRVIGIVCEKLYYKSNDATIHKICYTLDSTKQDILIFGSSRAQHHFIPSIITSETGLSSFNCGLGGRGLVFSLIQLNETLKRYNPKVVVLEVSPNILIDKESDEKLKILLPFNRRDTLIYQSLTHSDHLEKIKLLSSIYPYNSTIASLISGFSKRYTDTANGFIPLSGVIDTSNLVEKINTSFETSTIPRERLDDLRKIITRCQKLGIRVVIVSSPVYETNSVYDNMTSQIENVCKSYQNVAFWNFSKDESFYKHDNLFRDNLHLNYTGAAFFSNIFSSRLRDLLSN